MLIFQWILWSPRIEEPHISQSSALLPEENDAQHRLLRSEPATPPMDVNRQGVIEDRRSGMSLTAGWQEARHLKGVGVQANE